MKWNGINGTKWKVNEKLKAKKRKRKLKSCYSLSGNHLLTEIALNGTSRVYPKEWRAYDSSYVCDVRVYVCVLLIRKKMKETHEVHEVIRKKTKNNSRPGRDCRRMPLRPFNSLLAVMCTPNSRHCCCCCFRFVFIIIYYVYNGMRFVHSLLCS